MKKETLKKLSALSLVGITISSSFSCVNAGTQDLIHKESVASNKGVMAISTDEEESLEIYNDFLKVFPEEMEQIKNLGRSRSNMGKSDQELLDETKEMEPIIDTEKEVNDDYYRLVAYSNGIYYSLGVKDGTSTTGSGYVNYKGRKVYGQFYSSATNVAVGHTFNAIISYTNVKGAYDYIDTTSPYSFYYCKNAYTHDKKLKENSSGKAYAKFYYDGRVSTVGSEAVYNKFYLTVYVGGDTISVKAGLR